MLISPVQALKSQFMQAIYWFRRPVPVPRSEVELRALASETRGIALYYHHFCPVSVRICNLVRCLNIPLEFRDIRRSQVFHDDVVSGLGHLCTPCLRIVEQGQVTWLFGEESVSHYLTERFSPLDARSRAA